MNLNISLFCPETRELMLPNGTSKAVPDVIVKEAETSVTSAPTDIVRGWAIRKGFIGLDGLVGMFDLPLPPKSIHKPQQQFSVAA